MSIQLTIQNQLSPAKEGDIADIGAKRVRTLSIGLNAGLVPTIGKAYTSTDGSTANLGGTGMFMGIASNSAEILLAGGLNPTMTLQTGQNTGMLYFGTVWVRVTGVTTVGQNVEFVQDNGTMTGITSSTATAGSTIIPNAKFIDNAGAGELARIQIL